jgi:hypothetical protein
MATTVMTVAELLGSWLIEIGGMGMGCLFLRIYRARINFRVYVWENLQPLL